MFNTFILYTRSTRFVWLSHIVNVACGIQYVRFSYTRVYWYHSSFPVARTAREGSTQNCSGRPRYLSIIRHIQKTACHCQRCRLSDRPNND
jgi:hypothetical protein